LHQHRKNIPRRGGQGAGDADPQALRQADNACGGPKNKYPEDVVWRWLSFDRMSAIQPTKGSNEMQYLC